MTQLSPEALQHIMEQAEEQAMSIFNTFDSNEDEDILPRVLALMMCAVAYVERMEGSPQRARTQAPLMLAAVLRDYEIARGLTSSVS